MNKNYPENVIYISNWQEKFRDIYAFNNKDLSIDYKMLHFSTKCNEMVRIFNHGKIGIYDTDIYLIKAISWLFAVCNHLEINLEQSLLEQFPYVCHYCLQAPCICKKTNKQAIDIKTKKIMDADEYQYELSMKLSVIRNTNARITFDDFLNIINKIYPANNILISHGYYSFPIGKLAEEMGEAHYAYSNYIFAKNSQCSVDELQKKKSLVYREIADVTAWLISFWNPMNKPNQFINSKMTEMFFSGCPACNNLSCNCQHYSISANEEHLIKTIIQLLDKLQNSIVDKDRLKNVQDMTQLTREFDSNPTFRTKENLKDKLSSFSKALHNYLTQNSSNLHSTFDTISKLLELIEKLLKILN